MLSQIEINPFGSNRMLAAGVIGFALLSLVLFTDALNSTFLSDDYVILKAVREAGAFGIWSDSNADFFRPLMSLYFFLAQRALGLNPIPLHLTNVIVHALNSLMVCMICSLLLCETRYYASLRRFTAIAAGVLFLALPGHSEPVSWIAAGIDVFAAFFALGSVYTYIRYRNSRRASLLAISLTLFGMSLLSKEAAMGLPVMLLAYEVYLKVSRRGLPRDPAGEPARESTRGPRGNLLLALPHFAVLLSYLILRRLSLGTFIGGYGPDVHLNLSPLRLAIGLACQPARTYLPPMPSQKLSITVFGCLAIAALVTVTFLHFRKKRKFPGVFLLILASYFLLMLPVVNLSVHLTDTQGERFVYLPSALGMILLAGLIMYIAPHFRRLAVILACLLVAFGILLARSNANWRRASDIADTFTASLSAIPGGRVFILNQPDNIKGAYIFRNGLNEAVAVLGPAGGRTEFVPVCWLEMERRDDTVVIEHAGGLYAGGLYKVSVSNPASRLRNRSISSEGTLHTEHFDILGLSATSYEVEFRDMAEGDIIGVCRDAALVRYE